MDLLCTFRAPRRFSWLRSLSLLLLLGPGALPAHAAFVNFESYSPGPGGQQISSIPAAGVSFDRPSVIVRERDAGTARSGFNTMRGAANGEFAQFPVDMRFSEAQGEVSIYAQSIYTGSFDARVEAWSTGGSLIVSRNEPINGTTWRRIRVVAPGGSDIGRIRITPPSLGSGSSEFLRYDDLQTTAAEIPDTTPPTVSVSAPSVLEEDLDLRFTVVARDDQQLASVDWEVRRLGAPFPVTNRIACGGASGTCPATYLGRSYLVELPASAGTYRVTAEACDAAGQCTTGSDDVLLVFTPPPTVRSYKMEINQAVQTNLRDTRPPGSGTDPNFRFSVDIVPGKDTIVRYYLLAEGGPRPGYVPRLYTTILYRDGTQRTRTLQPNVNGRTSVDVPQRPATTEAQNALLLEMRAEPSMERTANYAIAGSDLTDARALRLRLDGEGGGGLVLAGSTETPLRAPIRLGVNLVQVIPDGVPPVPWSTIDSNIPTYLRKTLPFAEVRVLSRRTFRTRAGRSCGDLLDAFGSAFGGSSAPAVLSSSDPTWTVSFGVTPPGECVGIAPLRSPNNEGWRRGSWALTNQTGETAAHELGHNIGLEHAGTAWGECGGGGCERGWPYTLGTIGPQTWGMVTDQVIAPTAGSSGSANATLVDSCPTLDPAQRYPMCALPPENQTYELLSYGGSNPIPARPPLAQRFGRYPSDITYRRFVSAMINRNITPGPMSALALPGIKLDDLPNAVQVDALWVGFELPDESEPRPLPTLRKRVRSGEDSAPGSGPLRLEARDALGNLLHSRAVEAFRLYDGDENMSVVRELMPLLPALRELVLIDSETDQVVAEQRASEHAPVVELLAPEGGEAFLGNDVVVKWQASDADDDPLTALVEFSPDGGETWTGIGVWNDDENPELVVAADDLPKTAAGLVRIVVSDGLRQGVDGTECAISVNVKAAPDGCGFDVGNDYDRDGVPDHTDACPFAFDPKQGDADQDGIGDACECGDASGDGRVNSIDARLVQRCSVGSIQCSALCDVTGDGDCNSIDARLIQRRSVGGLGDEDLRCAERP